MEKGNSSEELTWIYGAKPLKPPQEFRWKIKEKEDSLRNYRIKILFARRNGMDWWVFIGEIPRPFLIISSIFQGYSCTNRWWLGSFGQGTLMGWFWVGGKPINEVRFEI